MITQTEFLIPTGGKFLAYTTIQTTLNRLKTKKLVARNTTERVRRYRAAH
jgi:predicted transcriptional regulator